MMLQIVFLQNKTHLKLFKALLNQERLEESNFHIIYYNIPSELLDEELNKSNKIKIPYFFVSKKNFWTLGYQIKNYIKLLDNTLKKNDILQSDEVVFYFFNEKNLVFHYLMNEFRKKKLTLIAVDEGFAFYVNDSFIDQIKKVIYKIFTPLLIGFNYGYYRRAGVHPKISSLYARNPEYINNKLRNISYKRLIVPGKNFLRVDSSKILFLTSPISEFHIFGKEHEMKVFDMIINVLLLLNFYIEIKMHPSELESKYKQWLRNKGVKLSEKALAEDIDISSYAWIVNFGSSAIIDFTARGYPLNQIVTIPLNDSIKEIDLLQKTRITSTFAKITREDLYNVLERKK